MIANHNSVYIRRHVDAPISEVVAAVMPGKGGFDYYLPGRGVHGKALLLEEAQARVDTLLSEFGFTE